MVAFCDHVFRFGDTVKESKTTANLVVHFFEYGFARLLLPVLHAVVAKRLHGAIFAQVFDLMHLHPGRVVLQTLENPVLVRVDDDCR
jgi:hypothetical protein